CSRVGWAWRAVVGALTLVLLADPGAGRLATWPTEPSERWALAAPVAQARQDIVPILECVIGERPQNPPSVWGHLKPNSVAVTIPMGPDNEFSPNPADQGQPTVFQPGRVVAAFTVSFGGGISWHLDGHSDTASVGKPQCADLTPSPTITPTP